VFVPIRLSLVRDRTSSTVTTCKSYRGSRWNRWSPLTIVHRWIAALPGRDGARNRDLFKASPQSMPSTAPPWCKA